MKYATALSPASIVNAWTCQTPGLLGWTNFLPYEIPAWSNWNGVNLNYQSFPHSLNNPNYQNIPGYSQGDTFTHELGHVLGMLHTFRNGVNGCVYGDDIPDTPPEATPAFGRSCNMNPHRKTCPGTPGIDPVWNIMDYSDDYCASEFTPDQVDMMRYYLETYRENLAIHEPLRCVASGSRVLRCLGQFVYLNALSQAMLLMVDLPHKVDGV